LGHRSFRGGRPRGPQLVAFEAANVIRRHELAELVGSDQAAQAHADLLDLDIELWPYEILAARAWELRHKLSSYDALAELTEAALVTLDRRISHAPDCAGPSTRPERQPKTWSRTRQF